MIGMVVEVNIEGFKDNGSNELPVIVSGERINVLDIALVPLRVVGRCFIHIPSDYLFAMRIPER